MVLKSGDPFLEAVKLAIAANSMDAMTELDGEVPEEAIEKWFGLEMDGKNLNGLKERFKKARKVVFLGDNCGEIVFDKLWMEILLEMHPLQITYIVRALPVMNDATLKEVLSVGIGEIAQVIENGIRDPLPGTFLKRINSESKQLIEKSDLVISKGGGNYDSLTEEKEIQGKTSFLFLAKCYPYCHLHRVSLNAPILYNF